MDTFLCHSDTIDRFFQLIENKTCDNNKNCCANKWDTFMSDMNASSYHPVISYKLCDKELSLSLTYEKIKYIVHSLLITFSFYFLSFGSLNVIALFYLSYSFIYCCVLCDIDRTERYSVALVSMLRIEVTLLFQFLTISLQ